MKTLWCIAVLTLVVAGPSWAGTIYEQAPGEGSNSVVASSTLNVFGAPPGVTTADNFALSSPALVSDVHWWGKPFTEPEGHSDFLFTFYADAGGVPGDVLRATGGSLTMTLVNVGSGFDPVIYYSSFLAAPFSAAAGTTYWLSVFNQAPATLWTWLQADWAVDGAVSGENPDPQWEFPAPDMAFRLTDDPTPVPEPSTSVLLAVGLVGLLGYGWWQRKKAA